MYNIMGGEQVKLCFGVLVLCDEWIGDLFEPVYGANQRYCGSAEYGETQQARTRLWSYECQ